MTIAMCAGAVLLPIILLLGYQLSGLSETAIADGDNQLQTVGDGKTGNAIGEQNLIQGTRIEDSAGGKGSVLEPVDVVDETLVSSPGMGEREATSDVQSSVKEGTSEKSSANAVDPLTSSMFQLIIGNNNPKPAEGEDSSTPQHFRLASAWPVRNDLLITSAYALRSMKDFDEKQLPDQMVLSMSSGERTEIADVGMHPQYAQSRKSFLDAVKTYTRIQETTGIGSNDQSIVEKLPDGTNLAEIEEHYRSAKLAGEKSLSSDGSLQNVGWIRLKRPLPDVKLITATGSGGIRPSPDCSHVRCDVRRDGPLLRFRRSNKVLSNCGKGFKSADGGCGRCSQALDFKQSAELVSIKCRRLHRG